MDQSHIGIIGYGVVGENMRKRLFPDAWVVDPLRFKDAIGNVNDSPLDEPGARHYRVAFVCVPTDSLDDGRADTSIVRQAIEGNDADVFVVKSTVPPGTCDRLHRETGKAVVMSPEFYGDTPSSQDVDHDFVILGGKLKDTAVVSEAYKAIKPGTFRILKTSAITAEIVKYAENSWIASKVVFFNEFYRICRQFGVDNDEFRELLLHDGRISPFHTWVFEDKPYAKSHCITKDVTALIAACKAVGYDAPFLSAMWSVNNEWIRRHDETL